MPLELPFVRKSTVFGVFSSDGLLIEVLSTQHDADVWTERNGQDGMSVSPLEVQGLADISSAF